MTIVASGVLSIEDIVTEFGGADPDALDEYYRGAGLVTENNIGVPVSGEMSMSVFYGTQLQYTKLISANVNNIVLSDYFTETEWTSTAPKIVQIQTGVTVGSIDPAIVSGRSGILVNGQPMAGTLTLINNGYIYGAGGLGSDTGIGGIGGDAFNAEIPMSIDNINGRLYAGGGGGGKGGQGADVRYYPETTVQRYSIYVPYYIWFQDSDQFGNPTGYNVQWWFNSVLGPLLINGDPDLDGIIIYGGYRWERMDWVGQDVDSAQWYLRRSLENIILGGVGGKGGNGIGSNQVRQDGGTGLLPTNGVSGGNGGNGGNWGQSATAGAGGNSGDPLYHVETIAARSGFAGGDAGRYIVGNANVTWITTGQRLGGIG